MESENEIKWYSAWLKESNKNDKLRDEKKELRDKNKGLEKLLDKWKKGFWIMFSIPFAFLTASVIDFTVFKGEFKIGKLFEITLDKNTKPSNIYLNITYNPDIEIDSLIWIGPKGDTIQFIVFISSGQEQWKFDNSIKLHKKGSNVFDFVEKHISGKGLFENSYDIICVGLASQEGKNRKTQEDLAKARGENLCDAVFSSVDIDGKERRIYLLDFGQHTGDGADEVTEETTKYQRSIIIVGVQKKDKSTKEIEHALKEAMDEYYEDADYYYKNYSKTIKNGIVLKEQYRTKSKSQNNY